MMEVLNLLISPIIEVLKCAIPPLVRRIDFLLCFEKKIEELKKRVEDLKNTRADVQGRVDAAKKNLESIRKVVEEWLEKVDVEITRDEMIVGLINNDEAVYETINKQGCKGWCSGGTRYDLGRKAEKKMVIICKLLNEGNNLHDVSDPFPLGIEFMPIDRDFEAFASREATRNEVMAALKDEGTHLIAVHGMGGVGKTMLMNQVCKQVKEEKLFDEVITTTISQDVDLKRIQGEIADSLGLQKLQQIENVSKRAAMLYERLKKEKRILVILDDLWSNDLDLSDVGIPYKENQHKGCRVVVTTRSLDVCNSLCSQKNIKVEVLSEEDSWHLFKKNTGDIVDSPTLKTIAREVVKECDGLPIALVTLGRALRNKAKLVWDDTAFQLKRSNFTYIEGMNSKVFSSIKLSYDYLGNAIIRKCFLLCCLFPEDDWIRMEDLMMYVMADDGILEDLETLEQARGRLHTVLDKLLSSSLLLGYKPSYDFIARVRMHDVVRDVAISIASEEGNGFFVKAGVGLVNWPERGRLLTGSSNGCLQLSLMKNQISVLPDQPELPHLLSLSLKGNKPLKKIPDSFCQRMSSLATLDLRNTGISSLPSSLSCLVNLRTLYLDGCVFDRLTDISLIGKLKKLVILSLQRCNLQRLPEEIGGLTNLKLLNLSDNPALIIVPPNIISSFSRLEELNMTRSFHRWEAEGCGNRRNARLSEVISLRYLTTLHVKSKLYEKLSTEDPNYAQIVEYFDISLGHINRDSFRQWYSSCNLSVSSHSICPHSIKVLLGRVETLNLFKCSTLKSVGQLVSSGVEFNNKRRLCVEECHEMESLMNVAEEEIPRNAFIVLEELSIRSMDKLKEILHGPIPTGFIGKLKELKVDECKEIVSIFASELVKRVPNLELLSVTDCCMLKDVFNLEKQSLNDERCIFTFSRLTEMYLKNLPNFETIWNGIIPLGCLENLKVMKVFHCEKLRCLFSPAMARSLQHLKYLEVAYCRSMGNLITSEEMVEDRELALSRNTTDASTSTNTTAPQIIFPNLKVLIISSCDSLNQLWDEKALEGIINADQKEDNADDQVVKQIHLRKLREIYLNKLPNLLSLHKGSPILNCPVLQYMEVIACVNFKRIPLTHQSAPQMEKIVGDSEEWFQGLEWENPRDKLHLHHLFKAEYEEKEEEEERRRRKKKRKRMN